MTLQEALATVLRDSNNGYAKAYADTAFGMNSNDPGLKTQLLYVLSNLQYWRGEQAKQVKAVLKAHC